MKKYISGIMVVLLISFTACTKPAAVAGEPKVFTATGNLQAKMDEFRVQLGVLNTSPGAGAGRREINWDGVADAFNGNRLPNDFFNPTDAGAPASRQRGLIYGGASTATVSATGFSEINTLAAASFPSFSGSKSFAVTNSNLWPVEFRVAGQTFAATTKAFGAVFTDVDVAGTTFLEFFNEGRSLGKFYVPPHDNTSAFSFLGVYFPDELVTRVDVGHQGRLIDGEKDITQGGTKDLVVLDDFIYSEPVKKQ